MTLYSGTVAASAVFCRLILAVGDSCHYALDHRGRCFKLHYVPLAFGHLNAYIIPTPCSQPEARPAHDDQ